MALGIFVVMAALVVIPACLLGGAGLLLKKGPARAKWVAVGGALGALGGAVAVFLIFFESAYAEPHLEFVVPPRFAHDWIVLIEDPLASQLELRGIPPQARIQVPPSGVLRFRDLDQLGGVPNAVLSTGAEAQGGVSRRLPWDHNLRMIAFRFVPWGGTFDDLESPNDEVVEARIRSLESGVR